MRITPRLVASFRVPANAPRVPGVAHTADTPAVQRWPHRRLVVIRRDDELKAYDLDRLLAGDDTPAAPTTSPTPTPARWDSASARARTVFPQRTEYLPGELAQCDLWFPPADVPLGFGHVGRPGCAYDSPPRELRRQHLVTGLVGRDAHGDSHARRPCGRARRRRGVPA